MIVENFAIDGGCEFDILTMMISASKRHSMKNDLVSRIEKCVFAARWALLPLYLGLFVAELLYISHFIHEVIDMFKDVERFYSEQNSLLLFLLELVDMTLITQLVNMTIQGGWAIFIKEFGVGRPRWLSSNFGTSEQKIKLGMSVMGIMAIQFLHDFLKTAPGGIVDFNAIQARVIFFVCVMAATFAFCGFNILMHMPMLTHHTTNNHDHEGDTK